MNSLTREQKLERIRLLEEKVKREKNRRPVFKDRAHPQQLEVLKCQSKERFVFAGNGSGKTALGAEDVRIHVTGHNPYNGDTYPLPCRAFIVLDKPDKIDQVVLPELRKWMNIPPEWCHKRGKPYIAEIAQPDGLFTIKFLFWDQNAMTAEGIEGDYFWFDEPPPRALYVALVRAGRTAGRKARYLITGTPLAAPWLRTEVYEPWTKGNRPNTTCFRFDTEANKHNLADGWIEEFSSVLTEKERGIRLRGEFFDLDGLALAHLFRRSTHTLHKEEIDWTRSNPCIVVMDPHPSKPHHAVLLGADRYGFLYVLDEYKEKAVARKFINSLISRGWFSDYRITDIVYDSLGSSEMTSGEGFKPFGEVINEELSKHGIGRARATRYDEKDDEDFITRIQDALALPKDLGNFGVAVPKLRVLSHCIGTIGDIENVQWKRDKALDQNKPSLEISNRDFLSCVKYGLACNLTVSKKKDKAYYVRANPYGVPLAEGRKTRFKMKLSSRSPRSGGDDWDD